MNSINASNPTSLWDTPRKYAPYIFSVWLLSRISFFVFAHLSNTDVLRALCQWDCHWFSHTALNHYDLQPWATSDGDAANWPFFPLFPLLSRLIYNASALSIQAAGILLANFSFLAAVFVSLRYLQASRRKVDRHLWVWLCCFGPFNFYFASAYAESLFWLLGCAAMLLWEQKKLIQAGLVAAALSATRIFGVFFAPAWFLELWVVGRLRRLQDWRQELPALCAILLAPLGFSCFVNLLYFRMGDGFAFMHVQNAFGRRTRPYWDEMQIRLSHWADWGALLNDTPMDRYSYAYLNFFAVLGVFFTLRLLADRRIFEFGVAALVMGVVIYSGLESLPRYMVGTPVFAFALYDLLGRGALQRWRWWVVGFLGLFNFWLLHNWFEGAYFVM